jgi:hypothetical protein
VVSRIFLLFVAAAAMLCCAGGAQASPNPETFADPAGDSGTAPDVTSVLVANGASGQVIFRVTVTDLVVPSDSRVLVAIDSDRNPSTGHDGTDYLLIYDLSDAGFVLARWDGSQFVDTPESTLGAGHDENSVIFSVNASELGNTTGFDFWVRTVQGSAFDTAHEDNAPDKGTFTYELGPSAVPQLTVPRSHATKARAGKPFIAVVTVARADGVPMDLTLEDLTCKATAGSRALRVGFADALGPDAGCLWNLGRKTRGKTIRASVTIRLDGATVTKTFTAKIK